MPVLSLARKASEKILLVKTITQGKSKPLVENIFPYQSSYWGMSTLAVPVLLIIKTCAKISQFDWFLQIDKTHFKSCLKCLYGCLVNQIVLQGKNKMVLPQAVLRVFILICNNQDMTLICIFVFLCIYYKTPLATLRCSIAMSK